MHIRVYANLKNYFPREFSLDGTVRDTEELKHRLCVINAGAESLLRASRFAVGNDFIDGQYKLQENDTVCILPPGSGG